MKKLLKKILGRAFSPQSFLYDTYHKTRGMTAAMLYGFPARKMIVIGITGTNGKTTTANLLGQILETTNEKIGLATTVNFWIGHKRWINETKMTTFSPFKLQSLLKEMSQAGCRYAIVETSSHAIAQHRTWGIDYDVAVFTNLTPEHLDFHPTFEHYRNTKLRLFKSLFRSRRKTNTPKIAVINFDDPVASHFAQVPADQKFFYSINKLETNDTKESPITANIIHADESSTTFDLNTPFGKTSITLHLPGRFNVSNALAAASTALGLGIPLEKIKQGLEQVKVVPGRMERIEAGQPFTVIVDYAHTPDGFEQVLSTTRSFTKGRLITVFGAAGNRDKTKRPKLGEIASRYADVLVLTEEDPANEDPNQIIEAIKSGIPARFRDDDNLFTILSRPDALRHAFKLAQPSDTVMLLAMGAQTKMAVKTGLIPYDERDFARNLLHSIVNR
ncbi:MAG: UDP-N-acetylmuramoyl-L-alanyl-D-glutamate--2,6-diaminopimelate ligase [Patescibacteria group bacterium]|jgi:UDP-N-acetylmuramyl-tripeptide synthetase